MATTGNVADSTLPQEMQEHTYPIMYEVDGVPYLAVYAGGTGIPYGDSAPRGDFLWAQAQLDVLKSATSQLISNDALSLSLLIQDNMGFDSSTEALSIYANADLLNYQNRNSEALNALDSLLAAFPDHSLTDDVWYKKAQIMDAKHDWAMEDTLLKKIIEKYADGVLADDALFDRAELYDKKINDKAKAMELYQDLLTKFPGSLYCVEARKRFRALRGDVLN